MPLHVHDINSLHTFSIRPHSSLIWPQLLLPHAGSHSQNSSTESPGHVGQRTRRCLSIQNFLVAQRNKSKLQRRTTRSVQKEINNTTRYLTAVAPIIKTICPLSDGAQYQQYSLTRPINVHHQSGYARQHEGPTTAAGFRCPFARTAHINTVKVSTSLTASDLKCRSANAANAACTSPTSFKIGTLERRSSSSNLELRLRFAFVLMLGSRLGRFAGVMGNGNGGGLEVPCR